MRAVTRVFLLASACFAYACATAPVTQPLPAVAQSLPDPLGAGWKGEPTCALVQENTAVRVLRCTFPPGVGHERHFHPPHFAYCLQGGTMRVTDAKGTREATIKAGDSYWSDGVPWHEAFNVGATTVQYLMVEPKTLAGARKGG